MHRFVDIALRWDQPCDANLGFCFLLLKDNSQWLKEQCMRMGDAYIIVYSVTDKSSFEKASELRIQLRRARQSENIPIILVGNKSDLVRSREVSVDGESVWLTPPPPSFFFSLFPWILFSSFQFFLLAFHDQICQKWLSLTVIGEVRPPFSLNSGSGTTAKLKLPARVDCSFCLSVFLMH